MPPARTAVGAVAAAIDRLQSNQFEMHVAGATAESFRWMAPEVPFATRAVLSNLWLFEPLLVQQARSSNSLAASLRTTTAPTIVAGGVKDNVIPSHARAVVNFRILPGDSVAEVVEHVRRTIDDPAIRVSIHGAITSEPSAVSSTETPSFRMLQRTIGQIFPAAKTVPYLVVGATDSRWYRALTPNIYRFTPGRLDARDLERIHGTDERIAVDNFIDAVRFYTLLIRNGS